MNPYKPPSNPEDVPTIDYWGRFKRYVNYVGVVLVITAARVGHLLSDDPGLFKSPSGRNVEIVFSLVCFGWIACFLFEFAVGLFVRLLWTARFLISSFHVLCRVTRNVFHRVKLFSRHGLSHFNTQEP